MSALGRHIFRILSYVSPQGKNTLGLRFHGIVWWFIPGNIIFSLAPISVVRSSPCGLIPAADRRLPVTVIRGRRDINWLCLKVSLMDVLRPPLSILLSKPVLIRANPNALLRTDLTNWPLDPNLTSRTVPLICRSFLHKRWRELQPAMPRVCSTENTEQKVARCLFFFCCNVSKAETKACFISAYIGTWLTIFSGFGIFLLLFSLCVNCVFYWNIFTEIFTRQHNA